MTVIRELIQLIISELFLFVKAFSVFDIHHFQMHLLICYKTATLLAYKTDVNRMWFNTFGLLCPFN